MGKLAERRICDWLAHRWGPMDAARACARYGRAVRRAAWGWNSHRVGAVMQTESLTDLLCPPGMAGSFLRSYSTGDEGGGGGGLGGGRGGGRGWRLRGVDVRAVDGGAASTVAVDAGTASTGGRRRAAMDGRASARDGKQKASKPARRPRPMRDVYGEAVGARGVREERKLWERREMGAPVVIDVGGEVAEEIVLGRIEWEEEQQFRQEREASGGRAGPLETQVRRWMQEGGRAGVGESKLSGSHKNLGRTKERMPGFPEAYPLEHNENIVDWVKIAQEDGAAPLPGSYPGYNVKDKRPKEVEDGGTLVWRNSWVKDWREFKTPFLRIKTMAWLDSQWDWDKMESGVTAEELAYETNVTLKRAQAQIRLLANRMWNTKLRKEGLSKIPAPDMETQRIMEQVYMPSHIWNEPVAFDAIFGEGEWGKKGIREAPSMPRRVGARPEFRLVPHGKADSPEVLAELERAAMQAEKMGKSPVLRDGGNMGRMFGTAAWEGREVDPTGARMVARRRFDEWGNPQNVVRKKGKGWKWLIEDVTVSRRLQQTRGARERRERKGVLAESLRRVRELKRKQRDAFRRQELLVLSGLTREQRQTYYAKKYRLVGEGRLSLASVGHRGDGYRALDKVGVPGALPPRMGTPEDPRSKPLYAEATKHLVTGEPLKRTPKGKVKHQQQHLMSAAEMSSGHQVSSVDLFDEDANLSPPPSCEICGLHHPSSACPVR